MASSRVDKYGALDVCAHFNNVVSLLCKVFVTAPKYFIYIGYLGSYVLSAYVAISVLGAYVHCECLEHIMACITTYSLLEDMG